MWVYDDARVDDEELFCAVRGTGLGGVEPEPEADPCRFHEFLVGDSESEPLSHASSSTQSVNEYEVKRLTGLRPM